MNLDFTHLLDTRTIGGRLERVQTYWYLLLQLFVNKGHHVVLRYLPGEQIITEGQSKAYGIKELSKHAVKRSKGMDRTRKITCPLNDEVKKILLRENPYPHLRCPWWYLYILDQNGKEIFYSHDYGSGVLMILEPQDLVQLMALGLDMTDVISSPYTSSQVNKLSKLTTSGVS